MSCLLFVPRLRQPQHAISQRPKLPWPESYRYQTPLRIPEPEYRLARLAVLADREDAGDINEAAGGLAVGALLLSSHEGMVGSRWLGRQAPTHESVAESQGR